MILRLSFLLLATFLGLGQKAERKVRATLCFLHPVPAHRHLINRTVWGKNPWTIDTLPRGSPVKYRQ